MVKKENPKNITFNLGNDIPMEGCGTKKRRGRKKKSEITEVVIKERLPHQKFSHKQNKALDQLLEANRDKEKTALEKGIKDIISRGGALDDEDDDFFAKYRLTRPAPEENPLKVLPQFGNTTLNIPPFFAVPTKKGWKLANPLTEIRNLAQRQHKLSLMIKRKNVKQPELDFSIPRTIPRMEQFSSKDQEKLRAYGEAVKLGKEDEYKYKNKPRGFPAVLYKNAVKAGLKETTQKVYMKNVLKKQKAPSKVPVGRPIRYSDANLEDEDKAKEQRTARQKRQGSVKDEAYWNKWESDTRQAGEKHISFYTSNYSTSSEANRRGMKEKYTEIYNSLSQADKKIARERVLPIVNEMIEKIKHLGSREYGKQRDKEYEDKNKARADKVEEFKKLAKELLTELSGKTTKQRKKEISEKIADMKKDRDEWKAYFTNGADTREAFNELIHKYNAVKGTGLKLINVVKLEDKYDDNDNDDAEGSAGSLLGDIGKKAYKTFVKPKVERVKKTIHRITHPKETIQEVKDFGRHLIHGRHDAYPPSAKSIIDANENAKVLDIDLHRRALPSTYTKILSFATGGETDKRIAEQPKDTLFHISMWVKLDNGKTILVEKNEVINMKVNPTKAKEEETQQVPNPPTGLSFGDMLAKTREAVGDKTFFSYSAKDNNCGNFIEYILKTNGMNSSGTNDFIGQDAQEILKGFPSLRKALNTLTDIAGRANVVIEGGEIDSDSSSDSDSDSSSDSEYNLARFNIKNVSKKIKSPYSKYMPTQGGRMIGLSRPAVMPSHAGHPALMSDQYPRIPQAFTQIHLAHPVPIGKGMGLYAGGGMNCGGDLLDDIYGGARHMLGVGLFDDIGRAFDPKQNGVAKAFDPNQNGVAKTFSPQLGRDITSGLIHQALPAVISGVASSGTTALTGNPALGFAVGQTAGKYAGNKAGDELGKATGYGLGCGMKRPHMVKGSKEAKEYMASIRRKKGSKGGAIPSPHSRSPITDPSLL